MTMLWTSALPRWARPIDEDFPCRGRTLERTIEVHSFSAGLVQSPLLSFSACLHTLHLVSLLTSSQRCHTIMPMASVHMQQGERQHVRVEAQQLLSNTSIQASWGCRTPLVVVADDHAAECSLDLEPRVEEKYIQRISPAKDRRETQQATT